MMKMKEILQMSETSKLLSSFNLLILSVSVNQFSIIYIFVRYLLSLCEFHYLKCNTSFCKTRSSQLNCWIDQYVLGIN